MLWQKCKYCGKSVKKKSIYYDKSVKNMMAKLRSLQNFTIAKNFWFIHSIII